MRKWLRFTIDVCTGIDRTSPSSHAKPWSNHTNNNAELSVLQSVASILLKMHKKLYKFSHDGEVLQVQGELHTGLAWITGEPVRTWYNNLDNQMAQAAFSAWIEHISEIPDTYADATGPIIASSYLVSVSFLRPVADQETVS